MKPLSLFDCFIIALLVVTPLIATIIWLGIDYHDASVQVTKLQRELAEERDFSRAALRASCCTGSGTSHDPLDCSAAAALTKCNDHVDDLADSLMTCVSGHPQVVLEHPTALQAMVLACQHQIDSVGNRLAQCLATQVP